MRLGFWIALVASCTAGVSTKAQGFLPPEADPNIPTLDIPTIDSVGGVTITLPGGTKPPAGSKDVGFVLNSLDIRGATVFTSEDFAPLINEAVGKEITVERLFELVGEIEQKYRAEGYVLSLAYLPPQETADGVVLVQIVEGYIGAIAFEEIEDEAVIADLRARFDDLLQERPVTTQTLRGALQGLNSGLGGFSVSGVLAPSETPGASDLIVRARKKRFDASLQMDNRGSDYTGPLRFTGRANIYNLGTLGDRLSMTLGQTATWNEQHSGSIAYAYPVQSIIPLVLNASASISRSKPGAGLERFEIESNAYSFDLNVEGEVHRDVDSRATVTLGFERRSVDTDILGTPSARDRIGSLYVEAGYTHAGWFGGSTNLYLRFEQGLPFLDTAEDDAPRSRADAESDYTLIKVGGAHRQPLYQELNAVFGLAGQYAFAPTYSSKEFSLGGGGFGRAYDGGAAIGEHGVAGSVELRYDLREPTSWLTYAQPYAFVDGGVAWDSINGKPQTLGSTGAGVRVGLPYDFRLGLEYAYALGPDPTLDYDLFGLDLGRSRLFFTLSKAF